MNKIIISLEGNIGAGKTTFLKHLEERLNSNSEWVFLREPVHIWEQICDKDGNTVLSKFYANPEKYAFAFQVMAYTTRYQELKRILSENPNCKGIICERSLEADKHIFAKMLNKDKLIDDVMYNIYERYFSIYEGNYDLNGIIHIHADPEICYQRILKRSRNGESQIDLDYLKNCNDYHNKWLSFTKTPLIKLDVNQNVESEDDSTVKVWLNKAMEFIDSLTINNSQDNISKCV